MNMTEHFPRDNGTEKTEILLVGKVGQDLSVKTSDDISQNQDKKVNGQGKLRDSVGGAAGNVAAAINALNMAYGKGQDYNAKPQIVVKIGHIDQSEYSDKLDYKFASENHKQLMRRLVSEGLSIMDVSDPNKGKQYATNAIVEHKGRLIVKENFDTSGELTQDNIEKIKGKAKTTSIAFLDPSVLDLSLQVAEILREENVKIVIDYGADKWPDSKTESDKLKKLLSFADYVFVPDDAVVEGMAPKEHNPEKLILLLQEERGGKSGYIKPDAVMTMSNGSKPIIVAAPGLDPFEMQPYPLDGDKVGTTGAGDTRTAAFVFFKQRGENALNAVKKASAMATFKVQHQGQDYINHILEHIGNNPELQELFANDMDDLHKGAQLMAQQKLAKEYLKKINEGSPRINEKFLSENYNLGLSAEQKPHVKCTISLRDQDGNRFSGKQEFSSEGSPSELVIDSP